MTGVTPAPANQPYAIGIWHYGRGLAFVARARLDAASTELASLEGIMKHEAFATTLKDLPLLTNLRIAARILDGELELRQGDADAAVASLREAVTIEDGIPYAEPPIWHHPPRQILGAILLEAGRAAEAEAVYREDLKRFRENGWSLFGLARSLEAQQRASEAAEARQRFEKAWARADIQLTSSRIMDAGGALSSKLSNETGGSRDTSVGSAQTPVQPLHGHHDAAARSEQRAGSTPSPERPEQTRP